MEKNIKKECIYVDNWITLLHSRVPGNIVNWLYFSKKYRNTHTQTPLSFYYLALLWVRNPGCSVTQLGSLLIISQGWYEVVRWAVSLSLGMDPLPNSFWLIAEFSFLQSWDRGHPFLAGCWPGAGPCCQSPCCIPSRAFCFAYVSSFPPLAARDHVPLIL